jgi:HEAT repeat protein
MNLCEGHDAHGLIRLLGDKTRDDLATIGRLLGELCDPAAFPPLVAYLSDEKDIVRACAVEALAYYAPLLTAIKTEADPFVVDAISEALESLGIRVR